MYELMSKITLNSIVHFNLIHTKEPSNFKFESFLVFSFVWIKKNLKIETDVESAIRVNGIIVSVQRKKNRSSLIIVRANKCV